MPLISPNIQKVPDKVRPPVACKPLILPAFSTDPAWVSPEMLPAARVACFALSKVSACDLVYTSTVFAFVLSVVCKSVVPSVTVGAVSVPVAVMFVVVIFAVGSKERVRYASPPVVVSTFSGVTASIPLNFVEPESNNLAEFVGIYPRIN